MDQVRIFLFQNRKVLFRVPVPDAVAGKDKVHFLECPLVSLGVKGPDDRNTQNIDSPENVKSVRSQCCENRWEE